MKANLAERATVRIIARNRLVLIAPTSAAQPRGRLRGRPRPRPRFRSRYG